MLVFTAFFFCYPYNTIHKMKRSNIMNFGESLGPFYSIHFDTKSSLSKKLHQICRETLASKLCRWIFSIKTATFKMYSAVDIL